MCLEQTPSTKGEMEYNEESGRELGMEKGRDEIMGDGCPLSVRVGT
jgi:hypothetical protein